MHVAEVQKNVRVACFHVKKKDEIPTIFNRADGKILDLGKYNVRPPVSGGRRLWLTQRGFEVSWCATMPSLLIQIKSLLLIRFSIRAHLAISLVTNSAGHFVTQPHAAGI